MEHRLSLCPSLTSAPRKGPFSLARTKLPFSNFSTPETVFKKRKTQVSKKHTIHHLRVMTSTLCMQVTKIGKTEVLGPVSRKSRKRFGPEKLFLLALFISKNELLIALKVIQRNY